MPYGRLIWLVAGAARAYPRPSESHALRAMVSRPRPWQSSAMGVARANRYIDRSHDYGHNEFMETVSKSALKARMLEYFRRVEETGEELVVTDNNRPTLRIRPIRERQPATDTFAGLQGKVVYREDVLSPTTEEWPES